MLNDREIHLYALDAANGPGFHVITPLRLADGSLVLVNRGYVPNDLKDAPSAPPASLRGDVTVTGLLRHADVQTAFVPSNEGRATSGTGATSTRWPQRSAPRRPACTALSSMPKRAGRAGRLAEGRRHPP